jgi:hypothetical protein
LQHKCFEFFPEFTRKHLSWHRLLIFGGKIKSSGLAIKIQVKSTKWQQALWSLHGVFYATKTRTPKAT